MLFFASTDVLLNRGLTVLEEVLEEEAVTDVDDSDGIAVLGHSKSLMYIVRKFGLECWKKNFKSMDTLQKYYAALSLNSIADIHDKKYMQLIGINAESANDLKTRFAVPQLSVPTPSANLTKLYASLESVTY